MARPKWSEYWEASFDFEEEAKAILKAELKRNRLTYAELADRFTQLDQPMTEPTLRNKISRGSFSAAFFLECLALVGTESVHLASPLSQLGKMFASAGEAATRRDAAADDREIKSPSFPVILLIKAVRDRARDETGHAAGLKEAKDAIDETDLSSFSSDPASFEQAVQAVLNTLRRKSKSG